MKTGKKEISKMIYEENINIILKIIKRNQRKILDLKSTISKLKNSLEEFNINLNRQKKK